MSSAETPRTRSRLWLVLLPVIVFAALAALFWKGLSGRPNEIPSVLIDKPVPDFVLNARTDAFLRAGDQDRRDVLKEAINRCRAFLNAGAPVVFVPGQLQESEIEDLVDALGERKLSLIGSPGMLPASRLEQLGVARLSFGPYPQRVALTALQELVEAVDDGVPPGTRMLT